MKGTVQLSNAHHFKYITKKAVAINFPADGIAFAFFDALEPIFNHYLEVLLCLDRYRHSIYQHGFVMFSLTCLVSC